MNAPVFEPPAGWSQSLYTGAPGAALLRLEQARTGRAAWSIAHSWTRALTADQVVGDLSASLEFGAPAVAFVLQAAGNPAYASALTLLDRHITEVTRQRLDVAHDRIDRGALPERAEFDLIRGLTGIGVYLLRRYGGGAELRDVLTYLVRLTEPVSVDGDLLPGWWATDSPNHGQPAPPGGHGNLGIAHGITGPLALLALAARRSVVVTDHEAAIVRILAFLDQWQQDNGSHAWWPGLLARADLTTGRLRHHEAARPSWCYGTPGIARAQQLAGLALDDHSRTRSAETALEGCVTDPAQLARISDATLCHGWAGLLQTTWRAALDAGGSPLHEHVAALQNRLDGHLAAHGCPEGAALLEGATGVELAVLTTAATVPPETCWDACLLLDG
ncbi:lanthionine synthetase C family protein [Cryptosporangium minutisporangium]|uniref:Lanthionine synthetase C family protein n=1 Tax=Cryptosporangium minutisporangium TaxID=113569 RepID=A0ABP6T4X6_9ACTN